MSDTGHEGDTEGAEDVVSPETAVDEAEAEDEAHEAEPPADEPAEPQEARGLTQAEWEKRFADSDKKFESYKTAIFKLWGDDAHDLLPVSISPSAPPGFIHVEDRGRVPEDVQQPIMEFFGIVREQDYASDPLTATCPDCHGEGKTKTGSNVPSHRTRPCPTCKGWGYTINGRAPSDNATVAAANGADSTVDVTPLVTDDVDNWGEARVLPDGRLNPNYGKQPQFKELVEPWGVTANLNAQEAVS